MSVKLGDALGQTFVIENRPGAGINLGTVASLRAVRRTATLLITLRAPSWSIRASTSEGALRRLQGLRADRRARHLAERVHRDARLGHHLDQARMIARAKAKPNELSYAHAGPAPRRISRASSSRSSKAPASRRVPLSGRRAGRAGGARRGTVPVGCAHCPARIRAIKSGAAARARASPARALVRHAGGADHGRAWLPGLRGRHLPLHAGAGRHAADEIVDRLPRCSIDNLKEPAFHDEACARSASRPSPTGPGRAAARIESDIKRYRDIIAKAGIERV